jgi:phosphoglycerate dehydrogenase-like enzyme
MPKVVLTEPLPLPLVERIRAMFPPGVELAMVPTRLDEDFARHVAAADVLLVGHHKIGADTLKLAPNVRFVQRAGVGYDNLDVAALRAAGVMAAYTPGANASAVAEHTIMLMLALLKRLPVAEQATRAGRWPTGELVQAGIGDLRGATVGLIGLGTIGKEVAKRLAPFGARIVYTSRHRLDEVAETQLGVTYAPLNELLAASTIVSVHVPLTGSTSGLIGEVELAAMRPVAVLVNTSRGEVVDEAALRLAIESGRLAGAALDVLQHEGDGANPFTDLPQVIITPHIAGASRLGALRIMQMAAENIARFVNGETPLNLIP